MCVDLKVREVDVMKPEHQAVAHRLGFYWFSLRWNQWRMRGQAKEDERLVDTFVYAWSYGQVRNFSIWALVFVVI